MLPCARLACWADIMRKLVFGVAVLGLLMAGCSTFRDRGTDYQEAPNLEPMTMPEGANVRPPRELYPIPPANGELKRSKKFVVPAPKPLQVASSTQAGQPETAAASTQLTLGQDGNGYPSLSITGDFSQTWDRLDNVLRSAGVKVDDRNQSLGLYFLSLPSADGKALESYQLKLTRGVSAFLLSLQKDDDTLAPTAVARPLFEKIQAKWPSGDK